MHMEHNVYIYILLMSAVTLAIRLLPLILVRGQIRNRFIRSFLYYVPYTTLAVMTVPAMLEATQSPVSGGISFIIGILLAWFGASLFTVSAVCCCSVFLIEFLFL